MLFNRFEFFPVVLVLLFTSLSGISGQEADRQEYRLLWDEANILKKLLDHSPDTTLLDSARTYADLGDYTIASVFVEQFLSENTASQNKSLAAVADPQNTFNISLHTGLDFNRQEFEVGYLQTDSVLTEQLRKPYVGMELNKEWRLLRNWILDVNLNSRFDKENFTNTLDLVQALEFNNQRASFSFGIQYDKNYLYPEFTYKGITANQRYSWAAGSRTAFRLDNSFRLKKYEQPSQTIPSFYHDYLITGLSYFTDNFSSWQVETGLEVNESIGYQNNDYTRYNLDLLYTAAPASFWDRRFQLSGQVSRFKYILNDSIYANRSKSVYTRLLNKVTLNNWLALSAEYQGKIKSYNKKSEQDPDYYWHQVDFAIHLRPATTVNFQFGLRNELKKHRIFTGAVENYIKEQNFYGNGIIFGVESGDFNSYLVDLNMAYTFRRYPDKRSDEALGIYTNRDILNITLLGQIPIGSYLYLNVLASYDNDRDLDRDESNTRNSFFSFDIEYRF